MRKILVIISVFLPFVAGCIAFGSESMASRGAVDLSLDSLIIAYGPMAGMLAWFMYRDNAREKNAVKRDTEFQAAIVRHTEAMTLVHAGLAQLIAEGEKGRHAIHRLADEVHDFGARPMRGNTRIMRRDEE